jgi:aspartyl protease
MAVHSARRSKKPKVFMGRIRKNIDVQGHKFWTLFDTGARNTYVVPEVAELLDPKTLKKPFATALGGSVKKSNKSCILEGKIGGNHFATQAIVLDEIGADEDGKSIQVLFGALAMQQWSIRPLPKEERLDLSHFTKEFLEF